jgi:hypothetical protein
VVVLAITLLGVSLPAAADMHFTESFITGSNSAAGEYSLGALIGQNPTVSTANAPWAQGLLTGTNSTFDVTGAGLSWPDLAGAGDGAVQFNAGGLFDTTTGSAVRTFDNLNMEAAGIYYMSGLMSFDNNFVKDETSSAFTGILNLEEGTPDAPWIVGVQWGFQANADETVDAVVRVRDYYKDGSGNVSYPIKPFVVKEDIQPGTHMFVMRVASDQAPPNSGDFIDVWVDPNISDIEFMAGPRGLEYESVANWLTPTNPERVVDTVVVNATNLGANAVVGYDEIRFGDTWEEVTNKHEPFAGISDNRALFIERVFPTPEYEHHGTYLRQGSDKIRGDEETMIVGGLSNSSTVAGRGLLSYSLDAIPDGAVVTDVSLTLNVKRLDETDGEVTQINLYLADLPDDFDEDVALWDEMAPGVAWTNGPGNPTSTLLGSATEFSEPPSQVVYEGTVEFIAAVQAAVDGDTSLDLALIAPFESDEMTRRFIDFWSDNAENTQLRPVLDIEFTTPSITIPGDTNGDDLVNEADAQKLAQNWGASYSGAANGDFNDDGIVNVLDAAILAANWTGDNPAEATATPEPSTLMLLVAGLAMALLRRRSC